MKELELPDGSHSVIIQGRRAFHLEELLTTEPFLTGEVTLLDDEMLQPRSRRTKALLSIIRDDIKAINECADNPITGEIMFAMNNVTDANFLINYLSATFPMALHNHQQLLEFRSRSSTTTSTTARRLIRARRATRNTRFQASAKPAV